MTSTTQQADEDHDHLLEECGTCAFLAPGWEAEDFWTVSERFDHQRALRRQWRLAAALTGCLALLVAATLIVGR